MNVTYPRLLRCVAGLALGAATIQAGPASAQAAPAKPDWREDYAYTLGMQAFVFGLPYIDLPSLRWNWVTVPKPAGSITPYASLNHFYSVRDLVTAAYRDGGAPIDPKTDPLAEWKTMNRAMTDDPPQARLAKLVELFCKVGVGPGQDVDKLDEASKRGLARAAVDGRKVLNEVIRSGELGTRVNGWNVPPAAVGRAGRSDDFLLRASLQCLGGIIANDLAEAVYFNTASDATGKPLDGARRYVLRFQPGQRPKVNAFWSIKMYDPTYNLVANPIDRYAPGDRSTGLKKDADGGLTIDVQGESPGQDKESNGLPSPKSGAYLMVLRTYMPGQEIVDKKWSPPGLALAN